jgi:predicted GNAT family N-acyltransferase
VTGPFVVEPLGGHHDRSGFTCGVAAPDRYCHQQVSQDVRRHVTNCIVAIGPDQAIAGYYTFAATGLPLTELSADETRRLPRYPLLPAGLIGRLAVATPYAGQRLGAALIVDAISKALRSDPAIFAIILDAKDDAASRFCIHHGFRPFISRPLSLFLPIAKAARRLAPQDDQRDTRI